jgi:uncharacterized protein YlxP (DUF503 family)
MVVSLLHFVIDLPHIGSLKEKRQIVQSVKNRLLHKFKMSVAEVELQESLRFAALGAAVVSNSKQHGESVMHKALQYAEDLIPGRIRDAEVFSEQY